MTNATTEPIVVETVLEDSDDEEEEQSDNTVNSSTSTPATAASIGMAATSAAGPSWRRLHSRGRQLFHEEEFEDALECLQRALGRCRDPSSKADIGELMLDCREAISANYVFIGDGFYSLLRSSPRSEKETAARRAIDLYDSAITEGYLPPRKRQETLCKQVVCFLELRDPHNARSKAEACIGLDSSFAEGYYHLALVWLGYRRDLTDPYIRQAIDDCLQRDPFHTQALGLYQKVQSALRQQELSKRTKRLLKVIAVTLLLVPVTTVGAFVGLRRRLVIETAVQREEKQLYQRLGIARTASKEDIKTAYKAKALLLHPDKNLAGNQDNAARAFAELKEAYDILMDNSLRADRRAEILLATTNPYATLSVMPGASSETIERAYLDVRNDPDFFNRYFVRHHVDRAFQDLRDPWYRFRYDLELIVSCYVYATAPTRSGVIHDKMRRNPVTAQLSYRKLSYITSWAKVLVGSFFILLGVLYYLYKTLEAFLGVMLKMSRMLASLVADTINKIRKCLSVKEN